jgi:phosphatidylinositol-4,5-bisphosphate 3-kinase
MTPYDCVSAWDDGGLIHVVPDSKTLAKIQADPRWGGGGAGALNVGAFSSRPLREYLRAKNAEPAKFKAACDQFTRSLAGYCVATLIMGIGDRRECECAPTRAPDVADSWPTRFVAPSRSLSHRSLHFKPACMFERSRRAACRIAPLASLPLPLLAYTYHAATDNDNIMVTSTGRLFHIDFGHILGCTKTVGHSGKIVKREQTRFVFTREMATVVKEIDTSQLEHFKALCVSAFNLIRANAESVINLFVAMVPADLPELGGVPDAEYMREMLQLQLDDTQAATHITSLIDDCLSFSKSFLKSMVRERLFFVYLLAILFFSHSLVCSILFCARTLRTTTRTS